MEFALYVVARAVLGLVQALPLRWAARLGRAGGELAHWLDGRHRRMARGNLSRCFGGEKSPKEIRALARENFRRIGENFACAARTAAMSFDELRPHVEFAGLELLMPRGGQPAPRVVVAIGHFGNFELYARCGRVAPAYQFATTYRRLRPPALDRLLQSVRTRSGTVFFERQSEAAALKAFMRQSGVMLGLLADQAARESGLRLPFLGHECYTSPAPAVIALRYDCALVVAVCCRVALAHWRIEVGPKIATRAHGAARPLAEIMGEVNGAFEAAVRRDPANWFWVHNRWKARRPRPGRRGSAPQAAGEGRA
jgi:KDO2-lipid IV(A) lauroyltransferase